MNIDIREYLRINPISVHKPTLSDNGLDCFLLFPNGDGEPVAFTQTQLFNDFFFKEMFQNLIIWDDELKKYKFNYKYIGYDEDDNLIVEWNENAHLIDSQFQNFQRRAIWNEWKA